MDTIILEIKDINGNSMLKGAEDKILIQSLSHSISLFIGADPSNSERTLGRPNFSEIVMQKYTDLATPALYNACASGKKLGEAKLLVGRNENGTFMPQVTYKLTNAMVSNVSTSGGGGGMVDSVALHFTAIELEYTQQKTDSQKKGTAAFGWDISANKPIPEAA